MGLAHWWPPLHASPQHSTTTNKFCQRSMLKSHVICMTRQESIHIGIVPVSPSSLWGVEWNPFQGKHYCPRGNAGAEVAHISEAALTSQHAHLQTHTHTHTSSAWPDLGSAVLLHLEIQHRQRIRHHKSSIWGWDWNHKLLAVSNHPE